MNKGDFLGLLTAITALPCAYTLTKSTNLTRHCTDEIRAQYPEDENLCFIRQYEAKIKEEGRENNIPPELIAAVIYQENNWRRTGHDLVDWISSKTGRIHTAGPGQVRTTTAMRLDNNVDIPSTDDVREYNQRLNDPELAITYIARELNYIKIEAEINNIGYPQMDILASAYRTGYTKNQHLNNHGYDVLIILRRDDIYQALKIKAPRKHREQTQTYLNATKRERVE